MVEMAAAPAGAAGGYLSRLQNGGIKAATKEIHAFQAAVVS
jgi:hypothetical protein